MKKNGILNSEISKVLSDLGHTDQITIGDCGLPIPDGVKKIDLAIKLGTPSFQEVLSAVIEDMQIEKVILAEEIKEKNSAQNAETLEKIGSKTDTEYVSHEEFKKLTASSKAIIRTGEDSPYSNIILQSGVIF